MILAAPRQQSRAQHWAHASHGMTPLNHHGCACTPDTILHLIAFIGGLRGDVDVSPFISNSVRNVSFVDKLIVNCSRLTPAPLHQSSRLGSSKPIAKP
jgi:hypothetical protein